MSNFFEAFIKIERKNECLFLDNMAFASISFMICTFFLQNFQKSNNFSRPCTIEQYSGDISWTWGFDKDSKRRAEIAYEFLPPKMMVVNKEYLIFDTIGLIASVGGTLGMSIGFSFSGSITALIKFIENKFVKSL